MNILFISEHYKHNIQGGGEINLFMLCEALAKKHTVHVLTSERDGLVKSVENHVTVHYRLKTGDVHSVLGNLTRQFIFPRQIVRETRRLLRSQRFDDIHLIGSSLAAAPALRKITRIPLFATIESFISLCPKGDFICGNRVALKPWSFFQFVRCLIVSDEIGKLCNVWYLRYNPLAWAMIYARFYSMKRGLRVVHPIAVSTFIQRLLLSFYGLNSVVVPNFVALCNTKRMTPKKPVVLYLGSLTKYKGVHVLLEAACGLDCTLRIYGEGSLRDALVRKISDYNLDAHIHAPVAYGKVPALYASADIVVFPSLWPEPFGRIPIEAMAARKPVVASAIGGIKETVVQGTGILFTPGNVGELREALRLLIEHPSLRKKYGAAGFMHVMKHYAEASVVDMLIEAYEAGHG
ncbi:MAG TPA: glycosyltransferase family 4 protein [Candidatus Nanoarchaeia archaeon]|nr:glycosyltransferase family 4 protein [Candidatus Nanoarchaeia archaeon]